MISRNGLEIDRTTKTNSAGISVLALRWVQETSYTYEGIYLRAVYRKRNLVYELTASSMSSLPLTQLFLTSTGSRIPLRA